MTGNSGFPKGQNLSRAIDRRLGLEREVISKSSDLSVPQYSPGWRGEIIHKDIPASPEAARWEGWHTGITPATEFWILVRKPYSPPNVIDNVLRYGVGGVNVEGCRIPTIDKRIYPHGPGGKSHHYSSDKRSAEVRPNPWEMSSSGRFPANLVLTHHPACELLGTKRVPSSGQNKGEPIESKSFGYHRDPGDGASSISYADQDGMEEVEDWECHPDCPIWLLDEQSGILKTTWVSPEHKNIRRGEILGSLGHPGWQGYNDIGGASRFFYCSKASHDEKLAYIAEQDRVVPFEEGIEHRRHLRKQLGDEAYQQVRDEAVVFHVTQKSIDLMRWLVRLITPPQGRILDPFAGAATTLRAALWEGFRGVGIDSYYPYHRIAQEALSRERYRITESGERDQTFLEMI